LVGSPARQSHVAESTFANSLQRLVVACNQLRLVAARRHARLRNSLLFIDTTVAVDSNLEQQHAADRNVHLVSSGAFIYLATAFIAVPSSQ